MRLVLLTTVLSSFALTAAAATSKPAASDSAAANTPAVRPISTGVIAPVLVHSTAIEIPASEVSDAYPNPARVVLKFNVDATGTPGNVQVVRPISPTVDDRIVSAVREFRWSPAQLDNQSIPVDMRLVIEVQH